MNFEKVRDVNGKQLMQYILFRLLGKQEWMNGNE